MPITADLVRELAARGERTTLDYKRDDYDWLQKSSNAELAKDLIAMANVLGPSDSPAHILIGVAKDGTIGGVSAHPDEADLRTRVRLLLNKTPNFVYVPVDVDGVSVGVYEIRPGGRPFFPLKDAGKLHRHVAVYRDGTSTDVASPTMILEWARIDDPDAHRRASLEMRKLEAEAEVHAKFTTAKRSLAEDGARIEIQLSNIGLSAFRVDRCLWRAEWTEKGANELRAAAEDMGRDPERFLLETYAPPSGVFDLKEKRVPAGEHVTFVFRWTRNDLVEYVGRAGVSMSSFTTAWGIYHFEIEARSDLGGVSTLRYTAS